MEGGFRDFVWGAAIVVQVPFVVLFCYGRAVSRFICGALVAGDGFERVRSRRGWCR
jgi:hypothetical protein